MMRGPSRCIAFGAAMALAGCDLAPRYDPPHDVLPLSYRGSGIWQRAHPDETIDRGPWWTAFNNPTLDALERRLPANPTLLAARESFQQGRELAVEAAAGLYPQLGVGFTPSENRESARRLFRAPGSTAPTTEASVQIDANASWEIDLWDRIGNEAKAARETAQEDAAEVASLDLSLQAELADSYLTLRGLDQECRLYAETVRFYGLGVRITELRLGAKIGNLLDVERAKSQLSGAEALQTEAIADRAVAEHAIATLIDVPASGFALPDQAATPLTIPGVPTGVPSDLLERRPDIAAAERAMAAANAEIGVARAAFFPNVSLSGIAGTQDNGFDLVSLPNSMWSVGAAIAEPLFEGGLRRAEVEAAHSAYRQTRDNYRATVLGAVADVEDELSLSGLLATEAAQDTAAADAAAKTQSLALSLYQAGADSYLDVVVAQVTDLQSGITELGTAIRAQQAAIDLVRALGGGWSRDQLPPERSIPPFNPLSLG